MERKRKRGVKEEERDEEQEQNKEYESSNNIDIKKELREKEISTIRRSWLEYIKFKGKVKKRL